MERSGRGTALGESERRAVWTTYEVYQAHLSQRGLWDYDDFVIEALKLVRSGTLRAPYRAAVVDEMQDLTKAFLSLRQQLAVAADWISAGWTGLVPGHEVGVRHSLVFENRSGKLACSEYDA